MKTLFGIKFDKVSIVKKKLFVELKGVFEAVFRLDFLATSYIQPILHLYDFKIHLPELRDNFLIHGKEFSETKVEKTTETRALRKAR